MTLRLVSFLSLILAIVSIARSDDDRSPNIVYIMADELGYYELGHMGSPHLKTPRIDQMAKDGLRFTNALAAAPVCAPVRACLMTGKHTGHSSVRTNDGGTPLREDEITIATLLKEKGYATGGFGKWGIGGRGSTGIPENQGFDEFFGYYDQVHAHSYYPPYLIRNSEEIKLPGNDGGREGQTYAHYQIMKAGLDFIRDHKEKPFFAYFPITPPHGMFDIPEDDPAWELYKDAKWMKDPELSQEAKNYAAMVSMLDRDVGSILDLLSELGLDKNTIVFFTGDNGGDDRFKSKAHPRGFFGANVNPKTKQAFRGGKRDLYEGGLRIPFIVRWPEIIEASRVSDHVFAQYDVLSTIAELVGVDDPEGTDGLSILPEIVGEPASQEQHEFLYWEHGPKFAVRWGAWKGVRPDKDADWELYDLNKDIGETTSLTADFPKVMETIKEFAAASHVPSKPGSYHDPEHTLHERDRQAKFGFKVDEPKQAPVVLAHQSLLALDAWEANEGWVAQAGSTIITNKSKKSNDLVSKETFGDTRIRFEYRIPKGSNSGIYFQDRYEVQIFDSYGKKDRDITFSDNGGIYQRWNQEAEEKKGFEGFAPVSNQSKAPDEWQTFDITFKAPTFDVNGEKLTNAKFVSVIHNGAEIHTNVEVTGPTRGGKEGEVATAPFRIQGDHGRIAFRKFEIVNSDLAKQETEAFEAEARALESKIYGVLNDSAELKDRQRNLIKAMTVAAYRRNELKPLWSPKKTPQLVLSQMESLLREHGFPQEEARLSFLQEESLDRPIKNADILITLILSEACLRLKQGPESDPEWPNWAYGDKPYSTNSYKYFNTVPARFANVTIHSLSPMDVANDFIPKNWVYQSLYRLIRLSENAPTPPQLEVTGVVKIGSDFGQAKELGVYLSQLGFMQQTDVASLGTTFTIELSTGLKAYQKSKGLEADGVLGPKTAEAISTVTQWEAKTLTANLHRARRLPDDMGKRYLLANLPSAEVHGIEEDAETMRMRIVFGKDIHGQRTPLFHDKLEKVVFRPFWNVPHSIASKEGNYASLDYLAENGFDIVSHTTGEVVELNQENLALVLAKKCYLRQNGGDKNALGLVKFLFPNSHAVYFHDTPHKRYFEYDYRAQSHGCVRLSDPAKMASWVFEGYEEWDDEKINHAIYEGEREVVVLDEPIPVYLVYFTAFPDPANPKSVVFYNDYYKYDEEGAIVDDPEPPAPEPEAIVAPVAEVAEPAKVEEKRRGLIFNRNRNSENQGGPRRGFFGRIRPKR